jgi:hypothetical protein
MAGYDRFLDELIPPRVLHRGESSPGVDEQEVGEQGVDDRACASPSAGHPHYTGHSARGSGLFRALHSQRGAPAFELTRAESTLGGGEG